MSDVYYQTQNYDMAVEAFQKCFQHSVNREEKESFLDLSRKCRKESAKQRDKKDLNFCGLKLHSATVLQ